MLNSVIVTTGGLIGVMVVSSLAGFALVWLNFQGRRVILTLMVASLFFPTQITSLIGIYQVTADLNLEMIEEVRRVWQFYRDRRPES